MHIVSQVPAVYYKVSREEIGRSMRERTPKQLITEEDDYN
jgi:hypothetical protein